MMLLSNDAVPQAGSGLTKKNITALFSLLLLPMHPTDGSRAFSRVSLMCPSNLRSISFDYKCQQGMWHSVTVYRIQSYTTSVSLTP